MNKITSNETEVKTGCWDTIESSINRMSVEKEVCKTIRNLKSRENLEVLDLGLGNGRHTLWFGQLGLKVSAYDNSKSKVLNLSDKVKDQKLDISCMCGELNQLPFANSTFDYILAWEILNQPDLLKTQQIISEVYRVLKPGAIFQGTILSKRNVGLLPENISSLYSIRNKSGKKQIFYCSNSMELIHILTGFELVKLKDKVRQQNGNYYWHFVAEKY